MYVIVVYDVEQQRVAKVCKLLRTYLRHEQRSVFEGELSQKNYHQLEQRLREILHPENDMCIVYEFGNQQQVAKHVVGKQGFDLPENFI